MKVTSPNSESHITFQSFQKKKKNTSFAGAKKNLYSGRTKKRFFEFVIHQQILSSNHQNFLPMSRIIKQLRSRDISTCYIINWYNLTNKSRRHVSVRIITRIQNGQLRNRGLIPAGARRIYFPHSFRNRSRVHSASYGVGIRGFLPHGQGTRAMKLTTGFLSISEVKNEWLYSSTFPYGFTKYTRKILIDFYSEIMGNLSTSGVYVYNAVKIEGIHRTSWN
jgi:hypothetical protein